MGDLLGFRVDEFSPDPWSLKESFRGSIDKTKSAPRVSGWNAYCIYVDSADKIGTGLMCTSRFVFGWNTSIHIYLYISWTGRDWARTKGVLFFVSHLWVPQGPHWGTCETRRGSIAVSNWVTLTRMAYDIFDTVSILLPPTFLFFFRPDFYDCRRICT